MMKLSLLQMTRKMKENNFFSKIISPSIYTTITVN